jgi:hypothetical protein
MGEPSAKQTAQMGWAGLAGVDLRVLEPCGAFIGEFQPCLEAGKELRGDGWPPTKQREGVRRSLASGAILTASMVSSSLRPALAHRYMYWNTWGCYFLG